MRKNILFKSAAILVCLGFISLSLSGAISAGQKASKSDVKLLLKKPILSLSSISTLFRSIFGNRSKITPDEKSNNIKITGNLPSPKPGDGN